MTEERVRLQDKVAIITGAGGGMGRVASQIFAGEGAKIVVAEFGDAAGEETVRLVREAGGEATFVKTDVSDEASARRDGRTRDGHLRPRRRAL